MSDDMLVSDTFGKSQLITEQALFMLERDRILIDIARMGGGINPWTGLAARVFSWGIRMTSFFVTAILQ
jgi:hypothetical protein